MEHYKKFIPQTLSGRLSTELVLNCVSAALSNETESDGIIVEGGAWKISSRC